MGEGGAGQRSAVGQTATAEKMSSPCTKMKSQAQESWWLSLRFFMNDEKFAIMGRWRKGFCFYPNLQSMFSIVKTLVGG